MRHPGFAALALLLSGLMSGCATEWNVARRARAAQVGPRSAPTRNVTSFAPALRCMDRLMIEYGQQPVAVLMEDLLDNTGRVSAGTRDMVISSISDMTRRSRAIRVNAFGNDSGNLVSYINAAGKQAIFSELPPYDVRGSISQLDQGVASEQMEAGGVGIPRPWAAAASMSASGSVLALDLSVISTRDLSVVPGVFSRNSVVLTQSTKAAGFESIIEKAGVNFNMSVSKADGASQAVRNLIELATIELFGRLFKLPYWSCLELDPGHADVQNEISDWYYAMQAHGELIPYLQRQLALRGYGPRLEQSIPAYREAAELSEGVIDAALFRTILTRAEPEERRALVALKKHRAHLGAAPRPSEEERWPEQRTSTGPQWAPPAVRIVANADHFSPGQPLQLEIRTDGPGHLYCFYTDERSQVVRFFPNRFQSNSYVTPDRVVQVPGSMPFQITASEHAVDEVVSCFITPKDILPWLPAPLGAADFEELGEIPASRLRHSIRETAGGSIGEAELIVSVQ